MKTYEITLAGFDGGSDETDGLVLWVSTADPEALEKLSSEIGATFCGAVDGGREAVDYVLPEQEAALRSQALRSGQD